MNEQATTWSYLLAGPGSDNRLRAVMRRIACDLSNITGQVINNTPPLIERVPIAKVATRAGAPKTEAVGVFLLMKGDLRGQVVLILPLTGALNLVDLLMGEPLGTATGLGVVERSALAELGNITLSYFLNAVAALTGTPNLLRPSSPITMVDMLGAILDVIVAPTATVRSNLLLVETVFEDAQNIMQARFWVLPNPATLDFIV
jgi:chemotaxis protein CheC